MALIVVAFGLLGLAALHMRMQLSDVEAYQRAQALILIDDMLNRMAANRNNAAAYVTGGATPVGYGTICSTDTSSVANTDLGEWCTALQGATEKFSGNNSGAMIGARGCVESINVNQYLITIAWQGATAIGAPPAAVDCGANLYDTASPACTADRCRRIVTTVLNVATLD